MTPSSLRFIVDLFDSDSFAVSSNQKTALKALVCYAPGFELLNCSIMIFIIHRIGSRVSRAITRKFSIDDQKKNRAPENFRDNLFIINVISSLLYLGIMLGDQKKSKNSYHQWFLELFTKLHFLRHHNYRRIKRKYFKVSLTVALSFL